jgi:RNA polymerase sigma-70 factor, ECF subfamily
MSGCPGVTFYVDCGCGCYVATQPCEVAGRGVGVTVGQEGAPADLTTFLREAQPFLAQVARRLCRNAGDVADLVQDTCEHALRGTQTLPTNPRAWLTTIMHNLFINRCRASARRPHLQSIEDVPHLEAPEPVVEPSWMTITVEQVREAVEQLEPAFREVYRLHVFEHRSYAEIAARLAIQPLTVGTRLTRARQKLRAILVQRHGGSTS